MMHGTRAASRCLCNAIRVCSTTNTSRILINNRCFSRSARKAQTKDWNAKQYLKFNDERTKPVRDLIAKIPNHSPKLIIDLGCGPGNSTQTLQSAYPSSRIIGMDSSPDMLAKARTTCPNLEFVQADLTTYKPDTSADLLFSNAVFQWLPHDQRLNTMKKLLKSLHPNATLALQVPDNFHEPSHMLMRETAEQFSHIPGLTSAALPKFPSPEMIYRELSLLCSSLEIWHTSYYHVLKDHAAIVEWVKGTGLRPFLDLLDLEQQREFLGLYRERLEGAYEVVQGGRVLLRYPRLFVVATRS